MYKLGSKNDSVKLIQSKLGLKPDGDFGKITEQEVKKWQLSNKMVDNGIIEQDIFDKYFKSNDLDKLKGHIPTKVLEELKVISAKFNINTPLRIAHFIAQCSHESAEFSLVNENLNYSKEGLKKIFGKYFPGDLNLLYARQPMKIGSRVYSNRMGNGSEESLEGYKYRGRGYIQLTGKDNYRLFSNFIGEDCVSNPDLVATKYPLASAAFFFNSNKLWTLCDLGSTDADVQKITRRVNGGVIGLADRIKHFKEYYNILIS